MAATSQLQQKLSDGDFVVTAEVTPPLSADPAALLAKALDEAHAQRQEAQLRATENRERKEAVLASAPIDTPQKARNAGGIVNIIA